MSTPGGVDAGDLHVDVVADATGFAADAQRKIDAAVARVKATVKVGADTTGLRRDVDSAVADAARRRAVVAITADTSALRRDIEVALTEATRTRTATIKAQVQADTAKVQADLTRLSRQNAITVPVDVDLTRAQASLASFRTTQSANSVKIKVEADTTKAKADIDKLRASATRKATMKVGASGGGGGGSDDAAGSTAEAFSKTSKSVADLLGNLTKIPGLTLGVVALASAGLNLAASGVAMVSALAPVGALLGGAIPAGASAAGQALIGVVAGFAGITDAVKKGDAAAAQATASAQANANAQEAAAQRIQAAQQSVGDAQRALARTAVQGAQQVSDAQKRVGDVIATNADRAAQAQKSLADATRQASQQIADAQERVAAATVQSNQQIADAQHSLAQAQAAAVSTERSNAEAILNAEQRVAAARETAATQAESAALTVQKAEEHLADTQRASVIAQEDLTQARDDARQHLQDLALTLKGAALDEEGAQISLERAANALAAMKANPQASDLDLREADLAYRQAQQRLDEVKASNAQLQDQALKASAAGVDGAAAVVSAQARVDATTRDQVDAQDALTKARQDQTKTAVDGANAIAAAEHDLSVAQVDAAARTADATDKINQAQQSLQRTIADGQKSVRDADVALSRTQADAAESIATARADIAKVQKQNAEDLADAQTALTRAQTSAAQANGDAVRTLSRAEADLAVARKDGAAESTRAATAQDAYAASMQKLSPAGREFVRFTRGELMPAIGDVRKQAQSGLLPGVETALRTVLPLLPMFGKGLHDSNVVLGQTAVAGAKMVSSGPWKKDFQTLLTTNSGIIRDVGAGLLYLADGMRNVVVEAAPFVAKVAHGFRMGADNLRDFLQESRDSGAMTRFFDKGYARAQLLWSILKSIVGSIKDVATAADPAGGDLLTSLAGALDRIHAWTSSPDGQAKMQYFFDQAATFTKSLGPTLGDLLKLIGRVATLGGGDSLGGTLAVLNGVLDALDKILSIPGAGKGLSILLTLAGAGAALGIVAKAVGAISGNLGKIGKYSGLGKLFDKIRGKTPDPPTPAKPPTGKTEPQRVTWGPSPLPVRVVETSAGGKHRAPEPAGGAEPRSTSTSAGGKHRAPEPPAGSGRGETTVVGGGKHRAAGTPEGGGETTVVGGGGRHRAAGEEAGAATTDGGKHRAPSGIATEAGAVLGAEAAAAEGVQRVTWGPGSLPVHITGGLPAGRGGGGSTVVGGGGRGAAAAEGAAVGEAERLAGSGAAREAEALAGGAAAKGARGIAGRLGGLGAALGGIAGTVMSGGGVLDGLVNAVFGDGSTGGGGGAHRAPTAGLGSRVGARTSSILGRIAGIGGGAVGRAGGRLAAPLGALGRLGGSAATRLGAGASRLGGTRVGGLVARGARSFDGPAGIVAGIAGNLIGNAIVGNSKIGSTRSTIGMALSDAASGAGIGATIGSILPGPGTAIGAAVGALVGGAYGALKGSGKLPAVIAAITGVGTDIGKAWDTVKNKVVGIASSIFTPILHAAEWLYDELLGHSIIPDIVNGIFHWLGLLALPFTTATDLFTKTLPHAAQSLLDWLGQNWPLVLAVITGPIGLAVLAITKHWGDIENAFTAAKDWVTATWSTAWGAVTAVVTKPVAAAWSWLTGRGTGWASITGTFTTTRDWVVNTWSAAWDAVTSVVTKPITVAWSWLTGRASGWADVRASFTAVKDWVVGTWSAAWGAVTGVVTHPVTAAWSWLTGKGTGWADIRATFTSVKSWVTDVWSLLWNGITAVITSPLTAAADIITGPRGALALMRGAFSLFVKGAGETWDGLRKLTADPIVFILDKVLNSGLIAGFNWVSSRIGGPNIPNVNVPGFLRPKSRSNPTGYADGGVMPGYTPGRDTHHFYSPTGGRLDLSGGETVFRPEFTRAVGTRWVDTVNAAARRGVGAVRDLLSGPRQALASGGWIKPANGPYGAGFGQAGTHWQSGFHTGQDIEVPTGTPVYAATGGRVTAAGYGVGGPAYGNLVEIDSGGGVQEWYAHLSRILVSAASTVAKGARIALSGATGNVTGPHLHFEVRVGGSAVDPMPYLTGAKSAGGGGGGLLGRIVSDVTGALTAPVDYIKDRVDGALGLLDRFSDTTFGQVISAAPKRLATLAIDHVKSLLPGWLGGGGGGGGAAPDGGANRALGQRLAAARNWVGNQWDDLNRLWTLESGWRVDATNSASGAYGIPQSLPADKMKSAGGDWRTSAATQIKWGLDYIAQRYGDPANAWAHEQVFNWYDRGGMWKTGTLGANMSGRTEAVLTDAQWNVMRTVASAAVRDRTVARPARDPQIDELLAILRSMPRAPVTVNPAPGMDEVQLARLAAHEIEWSRVP